MTETDKLYYKEMLARGRLIPFIKDGELVCFISFYITSNPDKYIQRENAWSIEEDEPETGRYALIDQLWSDRKEHNQSFRIWKRLVSYISLNFPQVKFLRWNRWKNNRVYIFNKVIKKGEVKW